MQTKKRCDPGDCGVIGYIVARQGNERNHVANLRINSAADSIENFQQGPTGRKRLKKPVFSSYYILDSVVRSATQPEYLRRITRAGAIFTRRGPSFGLRLHVQ